MQRIDPIVRTIDNLMKMRGGVTDLVIRTPGEYDPATSSVSVSERTYRVKVLVFDFIRKDEGTTTVSGTLIKSGDKHLFVKAVDEAFPTPQPDTTFITIDGLPYKLVTLKAHNPSGVNALMYEMYVRR